jgi:hypothetical protein
MSKISLTKKVKKCILMTLDFFLSNFLKLLKYINYELLLKNHFAKSVKFQRPVLQWISYILCMQCFWSGTFIFNPIKFSTCRSRGRCYEHYFGRDHILKKNLEFLEKQRLFEFINWCTLSQNPIFGEIVQKNF